MRNTILTALVSLLVFGCNKDKFSSTPQIKFKSFNTKELQYGQVLQVKLSFTDSEGDLSDSIYVEQRSRNCAGTTFKEMYPLPVFPQVKNSEGDLLISYGYRVQNFPSLQETQCDLPIDTCYFLFMLKDKAQHMSDTIQTEDFYLYK